jgi:hypothetical protein
LSHRARAFSLIAVLICVPALTRAHQPLESAKIDASFSFRKSIDNPPEKIAPPALMAVSISIVLMAGLAPCYRQASIVTVPAHAIEEAGPDSPRGPPPR